MSDLPLLSITTFLPLLGAFFILLIRGEEQMVMRNARAVAILTSLGTFISNLVVLFFFDSSKADFQLVEKHMWIERFNVSYHLGVDGVSLLFILLTTFLTPLAILSSFRAIDKRVKEYMVAFLVLETLMIGTFLALDFVLFYLFFEAVLIPMFLIIGIWGGENRVYSAFKFFLYTFAGSVLSLIAILTIYFSVGSTSIEAAQAHSFSHTMQIWLWLAFFASFAIKIPMWPVHTWLPYAHVEAPTAGSVVLAAILLKMGGYGFLRFSLPMFPEASQFFAPFVFILSIVAVVYTSLVALVQSDMKKLIAYSSIAHMGFVTFGLFTFSLQGLQGAMFQMISHGIISGALFLCVGVLYDRLHTRLIDQYGGVVHVMPYFSVLFMIFILGAIGLPGTSGFIGELLVMIAAFKTNGWLAAGMGLGIILAAAYALWLYKRLFYGKTNGEKVKKLLDLCWQEKIALVPLAVLTIILGIWPKPLLSLSEESLKRIVVLYKSQRDTVQKSPIQHEQVL